MALALWRSLSDALLWAHARPARDGLFFDTHPDEQLAEVIGSIPEISEPLRVLYAPSASLPESAVSQACGALVQWTETQGWKDAALQFAEAAAWAEPTSALRCYIAGRLCRRHGDFERADRWFRCSQVLARHGDREIEYAYARLGRGAVLTDQGRFFEAERHFWKAIRASLRVGKKSLAGTGFHDLLLVAVHLERWEAALNFAKLAVEHYKVGHPRFPLLAHDVAFMWCRHGFYSSALPVFEEVLPYAVHQRERILVLASIARSAAVVRDRLRFERAAQGVLQMAEGDAEMTASSLYHVGEGARCFMEWERAEELARRALAVAQLRRNATVVRLAGELLEAVARREEAERDRIPEEGGIVDAVRLLILSKLRKQPAPSPTPRVVNLENYPTD